MPAAIERRLGLVARNYSTLIKGLPEPLRRQAVLLKKSLAPLSRNLVEHYGAKEAYPLLRLPLWLEDRYVRESRISYRDGYGVSTATAALFGYLYIRIQDNVLDEPEQFDSAHLLLSNEFIREFFEIYNRLFPPGSAFWEHLREFWRGTSNNTLWERNECAGRLAPAAGGDLSRAGGKLDGAKISVASLCLLAGAECDLPGICAVMDRLNMASQLHNDVVSFVKDLKNRYFTGVIAGTVGENCSGCPDEIFRKANIRALTGDFLEKSLAKAVSCNLDAVRVMGTGGLPGLEEYVRLKNEHLEGIAGDLAAIKAGLLSI